MVGVTIVIRTANGQEAYYSNLLFTILFKYTQSNRSHDHSDLQIVCRNPIGNPYSHVNALKIGVQVISENN